MRATAVAPAPFSHVLPATGSVSIAGQLWDLRSPALPLTTLRAHSFAVRRLKFSPHTGSHLVSTSYDMTAAMWNIDMEDPLLMVYDRHTEFVCGVDFNLYIPGQIATASWDETTHVFTPPCFR